ncbi:hypothetical protein OH77DRAFT_868801 [Trametes cingulata]|nr:hypothetical protein OH77DRAFT_868801 [Trametes cingulata]
MFRQTVERARYSMHSSTRQRSNRSAADRSKNTTYRRPVRASTTSEHTSIPEVSQLPLRPSDANQPHTPCMHCPSRGSNLCSVRAVRACARRERESAGACALVLFLDRLHHLRPHPSPRSSASNASQYVTHPATPIPAPAKPPVAPQPAQRTPYRRRGAICTRIRSGGVPPSRYSIFSPSANAPHCPRATALITRADPT